MTKRRCHFLSKEVLFQGGPASEESSRMGFGKLEERPTWRCILEPSANR